MLCRFASLAEAVDVIHHHRVARIATRLGKRAMRERILMHQISQWMIQTPACILLPRAGLVGPTSAQVLEQLVHGRRDVAVLNAVAGEIQRGSAEDLGSGGCRGQRGWGLHVCLLTGKAQNPAQTPTTAVSRL